MRDPLPKFIAGAMMKLSSSWACSNIPVAIVIISVSTVLPCACVSTVFPTWLETARLYGRQLLVAGLIAGFIWVDSRQLGAVQVTIRWIFYFLTWRKTHTLRSDLVPLSVSFFACSIKVIFVSVTSNFRPGFAVLTFFLVSLVSR